MAHNLGARQYGLQTSVSQSKNLSAGSVIYFGTDANLPPPTPHAEVGSGMAQTSASFSLDRKSVSDVVLQGRTRHDSQLLSQVCRKLFRRAAIDWY